MSNAKKTPREKAEQIVVKAMETAESVFKGAIDAEDGKMNRLELVERYGKVLEVMAVAMREVSTEAP